MSSVYFVTLQVAFHLCKKTKKLSFRYTGCYKRWLNTAKNEVPLKTGQAAYCP